MTSDKRPKDMLPTELEALPISTMQAEGFGALGALPEDIFLYTDKEGKQWRPRHGRNGWYRERFTF
jgi:hypothetical protein